jgi:hypothetical protein
MFQIEMTGWSSHSAVLLTFAGAKRKAIHDSGFPAWGL